MKLVFNKKDINLNTNSGDHKRVADIINKFIDEYADKDRLVKFMMPEKFKTVSVNKDGKPDLIFFLMLSPAIYLHTYLMNLNKHPYQVRVLPSKLCLYP